ncbi:MAG: hypothetical protein ACHQX3_09480, partial [Nitrospirales bacterium]
PGPPPQGPNPPPGGTDMGGGMPPMSPEEQSTPPPQPPAPPPGPRALPRASAFDPTKPGLVGQFMEGINEGGTGNLARGAARLANDLTNSQFYTGEDWNKTKAEQAARAQSEPGFKAGMEVGNYVNPTMAGPGGVLANAVRGAAQFGLQPKDDAGSQLVAGGYGAGASAVLGAISRYIPIPVVEKIAGAVSRKEMSVSAATSFISSVTGITGAIIAPVLRTMMSGMNKELTTRNPIVTHTLNALREYGPRVGSAAINKESGNAP